MLFSTPSGFSVGSATIAQPSDVPKQTNVPGPFNGVIFRVPTEGYIAVFAVIEKLKSAAWRV